LFLAPRLKKNTNNVLNSWVFICSSSFPQSQLEVKKIRVYEIRGLKAMALCYFFRRDKLLTAIIPNSKIGEIGKCNRKNQ